ncbi:hypothetical protein ONZ45_g19141 [Pleurotus djamor]|nr:hypothetical protein ONZ45_g19141 [Pleurotus djamor]
MFSKIQQFFAKKATVKVLPTPPVMGHRQSDDKTLVNTPESSSSTSTLVDGPAVSIADFEFMEMTHRSTTYDVWHVSHNDSGKHFDLRTSVKHASNYEDFTRATAETEVYDKIEGHQHFVKRVTKWEESRGTYQLTQHLPFSLKDVAEQLPANGGRAQLYGAHMLFALAILHTKKIVHNDVKLSNVFLSETGRPLLGGMGRAKVLKPVLVCDPDFVDFNVNPDADGGYFHFETKFEEKQYYAEDIRGLGAAIYEMHTCQVLEFDARGEAMLHEVHLPPLLGDLLERIFGRKASPLKTNLAYVRSHPYFANIDWRQIAFPNLADATYHHSPLEFPKPEVDGPVYADIPEIDCDWEISYGKPRPPPPSPPPSPVEVNIMDLKLDEIVGRYAPLKGVRVPKYFESSEEEEAMLGSSFEL